METQLKRRELFLTNLRIFGFENYHNGTINRDMFVLPNKDGFEKVTYFLFSKMDVETWGSKMMWPILDRKMAQEFRKKCYDYLTKIAKDCCNSIIKFPQLYPTLLMTPGGDRFYELYLMFSTYILQRLISENKICYIPLLKISQNKKWRKTVKEKSLKIAIVHRTHQFIDTVEEGVKHYEHYEKTAECFEAFYRHMKNRISQQTAEMKEYLNALYNLYCETSDEVVIDEALKKELLFAKKDKDLAQVLSLWKGIEDNLRGDKELWDIVRSEIDLENSEKKTLKGHDYIINIPDILKTKYIDDLKEKEVQYLAENGTLSIKNFLNLWAVSIKCYTDLFEEEKLAESVSENEVLKSGIRLLEEYLNNVKLLNKKLTEIVEEEIDEIGTLQANIAFKNNSCVEGFPPMTPSFSFSPKSARNSSVYLPEDYLSLSPAAGRLSLTKRKIEDLHGVSLFHFSPSSFQNSPVENRGYIKPGSHLNLNKSNGSNSPFHNLRKHSLVRALNETSMEAELFASCFSEERSSLEGAISLDSFRSKSVISPLVEDKIVEEVSCESENLDISTKDVEWSNYEKKFNYPDALLNNTYSSPARRVSNTFDMGSVEKLAELTQHLHLRDGFTPKDKYAFAHISFSEEEILDDMTLPEIPFF